MTMPYKKKLIEVAIPLEAINEASAREKSIRHGHPSTLHLWWARRPLAACRAVLFAQLVDDPSSHPDKFPTHEDQEVERKRLFAIIEKLVKWENSTNEEVLEEARAEIRKSCGGELPPVYDPFSGGGSIPLEAQRLGLPAYGSDLNPVAVMIGKAMIEIPPQFKDQPPVHPGAKDRQFYRHAEGLAEDVRFYGNWMREKAWERIGHLYPQIDLPSEFGGGKATAIAWIWARTVPSPDPAFASSYVPIASSFLLSSQKGKEVWADPKIDRSNGSISWDIRNGGTRDEISNAELGTKVGRGNFRCLITGAAITSDYVRKCGKSGRIGQMLIAVVADTKGGRKYVAPSDEQVAIAYSSHTASIAKDCRDTFLSGETPSRLTGGTVHAYGLDEWGKIFTDRQLTSLKTFSDLVDEVRQVIEVDAAKVLSSHSGIHLRDGGEGATAYAEAICIYLGLSVSKSSVFLNTLSRWRAGENKTAPAFGRQAIAMVWDYAEVNPFAGAGGDYLGVVAGAASALERLRGNNDGTIVNHEAQAVKYPDSVVISTDPPYYDNISYADLSDFFFVWIKQCLGKLYPQLFGVLATPKGEELVAASYRHGGPEAAEAFFLDGMSQAISNMARQSSPFYPAAIYYAFKQSEVAKEGISSTGWATFLQAVVGAGYAVVGTWPLRTEMATRMIASGTNALANSVVLVCRKKDTSAAVITRAEFIRALKRELPPAISELQAANIAPADMPQSAIGPGMGVFSRYKAVLESDDSPMSVKTALQLINRELDEYLGGIQGEFDADTRFAISWFEQHGNGKGDYGAADNLARARGISVESVKHAGIVESAAGKVRILSRDELDQDWDPEDDRHLTVWECLQHLVRLHEKDGISHDTAVLLKKLNTQAEAVKDLAYCLYDICANKRKDAKEATAYNGLIADWTELTRQAAAVHDTRRDGQMRLDV